MQGEINGKSFLEVAPVHQLNSDAPRLMDNVLLFPFDATQSTLHAKL